MPPYFYPPHPVGAHITLVTSDEAKKYGLEGEEVDIVRKVKFSVTRFRVTFPRNRSYGLEARFKVWMRGQELNRIRKRVVGLVKPRGGFYIVVGVRRLARGKED